jgi:hypothetical protein
MQKKVICNSFLAIRIIKWYSKIKRITRLSFSSTASGLKLPIFLIVPRKTDLLDYEPPEECILKYKTGETFNDDFILEYIDSVLIPYKFPYKLYFIFDSAKCHTTPKVYLII